MSDLSPTSIDPPDAEGLRALFEHSRPPTFGVEEELMALDPDTHALVPRAAELLAAIPDARGFKLELPASQLEIVSVPRTSLAELTEDLVEGRARLARALAGKAALAAAGVHPLAPAEGQLNRGPRYERNAAEYGLAIRRQLVCGLHVHVGLAGAERVVAVYNELRAHLPQLAALGANAPVHCGVDSGMASVRPGIAGTLPRQGVPPSYASVEDYAADLAWGRRAGRLASVRDWWWELRIHAQLGTVEVRVPDAQSSAADAAALVATVGGLVLWLAARADAGELPPPAPSWRIAENRWSAARYGVHGQMADLQTGALSPTDECLHALLESVRPFAARVGGGESIAHAHALVQRNGADRQRELFADEGPAALMAYLVDRFDLTG